MLMLLQYKNIGKIITLYVVSAVVGLIFIRMYGILDFKAVIIHLIKQVSFLSGANCKTVVLYILNAFTLFK